MHLSVDSLDQQKHDDSDYSDELHGGLLTLCCYQMGAFVFVFVIVFVFVLFFVIVF